MEEVADRVKKNRSIISVTQRQPKKVNLFCEHNTGYHSQLHPSLK